MSDYFRPDIIMLLSIMGGFLGIILLSYICKWIHDAWCWWNNLPTWDYVPPQTKYYNTYNTGTKPTVIYVAGRKEPPKAHFFGRLDGEEVEIFGREEEKYMNQYELQRWNLQKVQNSPVETNKNNEKV